MAMANHHVVTSLPKTELAGYGVINMLHAVRLVPTTDQPFLRCVLTREVSLESCFSSLRLSCSEARADETSCVSDNPLLAFCVEVKAWRGSWTRHFSTIARTERRVVKSRLPILKMSTRPRACSARSVAGVILFLNTISQASASVMGSSSVIIHALDRFAPTWSDGVMGR